MGFKLAATTFSTKADDTLATVDAYAQKSSKVINATPDVVTAADLGNLAGLKGATVGADLKFLSTTVTQGLKVDKDALLKGVLGSNSGLIGALKGLPPIIQEGMTKAKGLSSILATVNGVTSVIKNANLSTLSGMGSLINGLSNTNFPIAFTDTSGLINLGSNLVKQATSLNIPGVLSAITSGIANKSIVNGIVRGSLSTVIGSSNVGLLSDIAGSSSGKYVTKWMPSFSQDFTKQFVLPSNTRGSSLLGISNIVTSSLSKIDSTWNTANRAGETVINMNALNACSRDMGTLLDVQSSFRRQEILDQNASEINTSAIENPNVQAAAIQQMTKQQAEAEAFSKTSITSTGFKRADIAFSDTSITSTGFKRMDDKSTEPPITAPVEVSLKASFPTVLANAPHRTESMQSNGITFRGNNEQAVINAKLAELAELVKTWDAELTITDELQRQIDLSYSIGNDRQARTLRQKRDALRNLAIGKYTPIFMRITQELRDAGDNEHFTTLPDSMSNP
jgi:hypothetical protein